MCVFVTGNDRGHWHESLYANILICECPFFVFLLIVFWLIYNPVVLLLSSLKEKSIYFSVSCPITVCGVWFSIMVKEIVFFCTKEVVRSVCVFLLHCNITLLTRSLILVTALFVLFSFFANDYNSQTMTKGVCPSCVERTTNMTDRRPGQSRPMRAGCPASCPSPAFLLGFFSNARHWRGRVVSVLSQCERWSLWKTNEITGRKKTS